MPVIERLPTPVGPLTVVTSPHALLEIRFGDAPELAGPTDPPSPFHDDVVARLAAYLAGDRLAIDAIAVAPAGTQFQRDVWLMLRQIRPGTTWSYRQLAERVERPVRHSRGGRRQWRQPHSHRAALSSRHRQRWPAGGLRRRDGAEEMAAGPRRRRLVRALVTAP